MIILLCKISHLLFIYSYIDLGTNLSYNRFAAADINPKYRNI